ncbi:uncharacterized protein LOC112575424 [Pomacea canaliculata]|uniref:uncharacterized protein LOC112575424 n=1 Tax=Pomacea canaliculata TaxID=400727 RepID=UPI000D72FE8D|nr:uncharacterized protein LOC112575424 [Pomacea canaliculata]
MRCHFSLKVLLEFILLLEFHLTWSLRFSRCPVGHVYNPPELTFFAGYSGVHCAVLCSQTAQCRAVSVCPGDSRTRGGGGSRGVRCALHMGQQVQSCDALDAAPSPSCFYMKKMSDESEQNFDAEISTHTVAVSTETPFCLNGGTLVDGKCHCQIQYSGFRCQRLIRDCTEAFSNGYTNDSLSDVYWIQPLLAPAPFLIHCGLNNGGVSHPLKMTSWVNPNLTWQELKSGNNLTNYPHNYFIGLENLYYLVSQADYTNHMYFMFNNYQGWASSFYHRFTIGPESKNYSLSYTTHDTLPDHPSDNNLMSSPVFCTVDHCPTTCAQQMNSSGWYNSSCSGLTLSTNQTLAFQRQHQKLRFSGV